MTIYNLPFMEMGKIFFLNNCIKTKRINSFKKTAHRNFPGGAVVKNPPASAGDMGSSPGPGRSHMLRSN